VTEAVAAQPELPLAAPAAPKRFIIPDDPVVTAPSGAEKPKAVAESAGATPGAQNTGDEATPATPEAKPDEGLTPEQVAERDRKREGRRIEKKLGKAYREAAEAKARADLAERQLNEARQANAPKAPEGEPKLADFDYDPEKYATAKAEYAKTQAAKELDAKQKQESVKAEHAKLISSWEEKVDSATDKYDDFSTVVGDLQPNTPFVAAVMHAENGADVAYHLGKNPKEAERIARLQPLLQVFEIGKLAAKLSAEPAKPKAPSKAPAPITPLTGAAPTTSNSLDDKDLPDAVWMQRRNKSLAAKRR